MKDLVVIGGGPGGYVAAIRARQLGMNVTLIEKDAMGGTCLNRGCIPTKAYYRNALAMRDILNCDEFNIQVEKAVFNMKAARQRKDRIVDNLVAGIEKLLQTNGVEKIIGAATLIDKNHVLVNGQEIATRNILLATGSIPAPLPIEGINLPGVINSDQLLEWEEVPAKLAIIGGGVIGLEFACIFNSLGSEVTVFEYTPDLLNSMDNELGKRLRVFLKKQGITVHTATTVEKITLRENILLVTAMGKKEAVTSAADVILIASGRKPYTAGLNLDK
ncbi:MAG: NAD(P)/FAD-dependent oxidoreductase, partial [Syntrophomonadaceae bacterium]|nr:NAD(P)/FAD-dependent oxidoreductase [Syntrophomonadaceae bacterium]